MDNSNTSILYFFASTLVVCLTPFSYKMHESQQIFLINLLFDLSSIFRLTV